MYQNTPIDINTANTNKALTVFHTEGESWCPLILSIREIGNSSLSKDERGK